MRTCLQNFSNTQYMTSGAAYGAGVYTAKHVSSSSPLDLLVTSPFVTAHHCVHESLVPLLWYMLLTFTVLAVCVGCNVAARNSRAVYSPLPSFCRPEPV